ncbi:MAG: SIR2 family protein [Bacteroidetes bacterium]|nr:SIR2 family protein [Bacteroidota bacterium]
MKDIHTSTENNAYKGEDKITAEIANKLAFNYFTNSFEDNCELEDFKSAVEYSLNDASLINEPPDSVKKKRIRNILIVGAGASFDSFFSMPLGRDMRDEIKAKCLINMPDFFKSKYDYEEKTIKAITGKSELSFENYLSLVNKLFFTPQELRNEIAEMTKLRYAPSLFNEIVAHMLKHSFLDVVINYNFEETLDQAIEDEIGSANYHEILFDGQCPSFNEISKGGRLTTPIYIKPHGTGRHKSTLRFTNNHYLELPADIRQMLENLLEGKLENENSISEINLFVVGFAMESFELNEILKNCLNNNVETTYKIYHIDYDPIGINNQKLHSFLKDIGITEEKFQIKDEHYEISDRLSIIPLSTNNTQGTKEDRLFISPLSKMFSLIWRKAQDEFKKPYKPRSIAKHEIIYYLLCDKALIPNKEIKEGRNTLFKKYDNFESEETVNYFRDRALIEIAISFIRNKGIVDIIELLKGKPGKYHELYLKVFHKSKGKGAPNSIFDLVNSLLIAEEDGADIFSGINNLVKLRGKDEQKEEIKKVINKIKSDSFYGSKAGFADRIQLHYEKSLEDESLLLPTYIMVKLLNSDFLSERTKCHVSENFAKEVFNSHPPGSDLYNKNIFFLDELFRLFQKSYQSHYYIINPRERDSIHNMFETYERKNTLHTNLAFDLQFRKLLEQDWDIALIVAERGAFLDLIEDEKDQFKNKRIFLICSSEALLPYSTDEVNSFTYSDLKNRFRKKFSNLNLLVTPSREHNHHMAVFLKFNNSGQPNNNKLRLYDSSSSSAFDFLLLDAIYHFRMSFSNSIDPIVIKSNPCNNDNAPGPSKNIRDYAKLINLFHLLFIRSLDYMKRISEELFRDDVFIYQMFQSRNSKEDYKHWPPETYSKKTNEFLKILYDSYNPKGSD